MVMMGIVLLHKMSFLALRQGIILKLSVTKPHTLGKKLSSKHCKQINANLIRYKNFKRIP